MLYACGFQLCCSFALRCSLRPRRRTRLALLPHRAAREQLAARRERVAALRTPEDVAARVAAFRHLLRIMGGLPAEKPPLQLRRTGRRTAAITASRRSFIRASRACG